MENNKKIQKDIEISLLLENIYNETNDRITKEFIEDWRHKIVKYNKTSIKKIYEEIVTEQVKQKLSEKYKKELNQYIEFKQEIQNKYNELVKNLEICNKEIKKQKQQNKNKSEHILI